MDDILNVIRQRRSIRRYQAKPVPKRVIETLIETGMYAPSALNKQPWKFIVITNPEIIAQISRSIRNLVSGIYRRRKWLKFFSKQLKDEKSIQALKRTAQSEVDTIFYDAPVVILIVANKDNHWARTDCALAAQNIMLAAHSLGLGTCFIGRIKLLHYYKHLCKQLSIEPKQRVYAALALGYPQDGEISIPQRQWSNKIKWIA